ncbi:EamA family transporter [Paenibacillus lutimineralis]|uniref:EamA family transporter n=1 Tax=Paenibacillus lutimineralis TaxID=2707005 RepID=A0A3Q9IBL1_9BACL|nr:DMT family transporter [Paenibacillus lutimineralis]AZS15446.1 EamA family transporter [Paenibacillus lutimineralis]
MNRNTLLTGIIYYLIPVLAWGGMFPVMQVALKVLDPFYFTTIRYIWAGLILLGMLIVFEGKNVLRLEGKSYSLRFQAQCWSLRMETPPKSFKSKSTLAPVC